MGKHWTDEDVARMLGWTEHLRGDGLAWVEYTGPRPHAYRAGVIPKCGVHFGLSTPPGLDADRSAVKYVKPWILDQSPEFRAKLRRNLLDAHDGDGDLYEYFLYLDGPTLCRAALEAMDGAK